MITENFFLSCFPGPLGVCCFLEGPGVLTGAVMRKVKEKLTLICLAFVGVVRSAEGSAAPKDTEIKDKTVQTKYKVVESFVSSTDGKAARNVALT